jgi:hypothetical protein
LEIPIPRSSLAEIECDQSIVSGLLREADSKQKCSRLWLIGKAFCGTTGSFVTSYPGYAAIRMRSGISVAPRSKSALSTPRSGCVSMKLPLTVLLLLSIGPLALAQQPLVSRFDQLPPSPAPAITIPSSTLSAPQITPEMWLYLQEQRRHDDPAQAVRRKAEYKADQRMARITTSKWYGYSNSRPEASSIPFMGDYSPGWVGNGLSRYQWIAAGTPYFSYGIIR